MPNDLQTPELIEDILFLQELQNDDDELIPGDVNFNSTHMSCPCSFTCDGTW